MSRFILVMISSRFLDALESSAPVGSSASSRDCPATMARAQAARCFLAAGYLIGEFLQHVHNLQPGRHLPHPALHRLRVGVNSA